MKRTRRIVCTASTSSVGRDTEESIWLLPDEMDWTAGKRSFDLLGTTDILGHLPVDEVADGRTQDSDSFLTLDNSLIKLHLERVSYGIEPVSQIGGLACESEKDVKSKLIQLLHAMWLVFDYEPKTIDQGIMWLGMETVQRCLVVAEVFALLERKNNLSFGAEILWQHSLRTGCLAGFLAKEEQSASTVIAQSCIGGFSHDIGLAILAVSLESTRYLDVMAYARQRSLTLATAELLELGISHEIVGAEFLQRRKFSKTIVDAVAFHDEPLGCGGSGLTPTIAVYAANILDGGGWPQDSDGVPSERSMEYLSSHGFADPWPKWKRYVEPLHHQEFRRA